MTTMKKDLSGIIAMLITPFDKNENVDHGALRAEVDWCMAQGCQGVVATPSIGEFACLSNEERWKCFETVADQMSKYPDKLKLSTVAAPYSRDVVEHCKVSKELGYDGAQLIPPYYWIPDEEEVYRHYQTATETGLPIIAYHNPKLSKFYMRREFMIKLAEIPGIVGFKEVETDRHVQLEPLFHALVGKKRLFTTFRVFTTGLILGSSGGLINLFAVPACIKMYQLFKAGERDRMEKIQIIVNEVFPRGGEDNKKHIGTTKMVSSVVSGINFGSPRAPYMLPDSKYEARLRQTLPELQALLK